jgi:hypothetical protein
MEVYRGGSVADKDELAYVGVGQGAFAKSCRSVADTVTKWGGGPVKTTTASGRVACAFTGKVELKAIPGTGGAEQLIVTLGHTPATALYANVAAAGSKLNYDSRYCRFTAIKAG